MVTQYVFSGHAVVLAVVRSCTPLLLPGRQVGTASESLVCTAAERRQVVQVMSGLTKALNEMAVEEHRG